MTAITPPDVAPAPPLLEVGMLLYPQMTALDLIGPQTAFGFHSRTHLFWKTLDPVLTDSGVSIVPTATFEDDPRALDVLFVPGGFGTNACMQDPAVLDFLAERGKTARYITSVCTGSLILGAAGLLNGYRAATHWAFYGSLEALGVDAVHERVCVDRNRFTGGGVTAGIDFGLKLLAELRGEATAKMTQLLMEYDPQPPFNAGSPAGAGAGTMTMATGMMGSHIQEAVDIAKSLRSSRVRAA